MKEMRVVVLVMNLVNAGQGGRRKNSVFYARATDKSYTMVSISIYNTEYSNGNR